MAAITVSGIRKDFGTARILRDVSLTIADGEFMTLVGPSGCGKSTLLRILAGLEVQDGGSIAIGDRDVSALPPKQRDVAMVFQSYALYPHLTVGENMAVPLLMRQLSTLDRLPLLGRMMPGRRARVDAIGAKVREVAESLHIAHLLDRKPGQLSGGQRQRVAVGRAMVRDPAVFLMDEPLSNLDAKLRVHMRAEIAQLHRRLRGTFVYVTHDQAEAMTMSDRIAVMMDGEILQCAPPDEVYRRPSCLRVAEFIGSPKIGLLPARRTADGLDVLGLSVPLLPPDGAGASLTVGVRPEAWRIVAPKAGRLPARVVHRENMGGEIFVHAAVAGVEAPLVVRLDAEQSALAPLDAAIGLDVAADRLLVFGEDGRRVEPAFVAVPREAAHG